MTYLASLFFPVTAAIGAMMVTFFDGRNLSFDGVDEHVQITDSASLDVTNNLTYGCWFKTSSATFQGIISKYDTGADQRSYLINYDNSPDSVQFAITDSGVNAANRKIYNTNSSFADGSWHHAAATFASGTFKIYMDGSNIASPTITLDEAATTIFAGTGDLHIGSRSSSGSATNFFNGTIGDCAIWDTAVLTDSEVSEWYNGGRQSNLLEHSQSANLVSWWRMGDSDDSISTIIDRVGSNDGTPTNMEAADIVSDAP